VGLAPSSKHRSQPLESARPSGRLRPPAQEVDRLDRRIADVGDRLVATADSNGRGGATTGGGATLVADTEWQGARRVGAPAARIRPGASTANSVALRRPITSDSRAAD